MTDVDTALEQKVLDIAQRKRKADVHHNHEPDHLRRRVETTERARRQCPRFSAHPGPVSSPRPACHVGLTKPVAKLGAFPASPEQAALKDWELDPDQDEDGFRHAAVRYSGEHDAVFELRVQLWADAETQPIEDTSVDWPEEDSRYLTVGTIRIPRQEAYSASRVQYFDDVMTFRPARSLAAHRPLGSVMRARLQVYRALSALRHRDNGVAEQNTASIDQIPA
ncbi:hypothetical protein U1737_00185 [Sphingomonas sp. LB3N6]|uniref:hypothetical protein n=1 Tax=Sphingomonas fucosidasi TaxID=3096164 RepID=UPI002FCC036C